MIDKKIYHVLIVDDEAEIRKLLGEGIRYLGYSVSVAVDGADAINLVNSNHFDIVILDVEMPRVDGLEVLQHIKEHSPWTEVIMLTGVKDIRIAVSAIKLGASDYLTKPTSFDELEIVIEKCLRQKSLRTSTFLMQRSLDKACLFDAVVGNSEPWLALLEKAKRFADDDYLIHIEGESGTGKEVLAHYIHTQSRRKEHPFVMVDCGVLHSTLIESELFGHIKGSFTGADTNKEGLVEIAQGGTLFLDEIGHIDLTFQQKLLKFVETKTYRRVGDTATRTVDVRIITATNKNLAEEVRVQQFRNDLWYRLNVMKLEIPPLRSRRSDIKLFAEYFLDKFKKLQQPKKLTEEALTALERYQWPGNVRELQSTIQRAIALSGDDFITIEDLAIEPNISIHVSDKFDSNVLHTALISLAESENKHIQFVLHSVDWNISQAAKILQIGRNTLYAKMKEYGIEHIVSK
ncbi:MAG: sigma-54-dependent Fis family transcriptional regulator [Ignavibacteriae bacterium]|nr:sigma-54-dependent Fis family transcriptional regulator [Ignavibacteriota bacterium]